MRIVHILHGAGGGALRVVEELASAQGEDAFVFLGDKSRTRLSLATSRLDYRSVRHHTYSLIPVPLLGGLLPPPTKAMDRLARVVKQDPDCVIHFHNHGICGMWIRFCKARLAERCVVTIHGILPQDVLALGRLPRVHKRIHQYSLEFALAAGAKLVACSDATKDSAREMYPFLKNEHVEVVENGIALPTRNVSCAKDDRIRIGLVASLEPIKNIANCILALDEICNRHTEVDACVYGSGALASPKLDTSRSRVRFMGHVEDAGSNVIPALDCLLLASYSEGMPIAALEAIAAGVPLVCTPVGGLRTLLELGCGVRIDGFDAASIVAALEVFLASNRVGFSGAATATFRSRYTVDQMKCGYDAVYGRSRV